MLEGWIAASRDRFTCADFDFLSGAPDLGFYESFARRSFQSAADNPAACGKVSRKLFGALADAMPDARKSLNRLAEEFVFLGD